MAMAMAMAANGMKKFGKAAAVWGVIVKHILR
jgi:hypothetical protein